MPKLYPFVLICRFEFPVLGVLAGFHSLFWQVSHLPCKFRDNHRAGFICNLRQLATKNSRNLLCFLAFLICNCNLVAFSCIQLHSVISKFATTPNYSELLRYFNEQRQNETSAVVRSTYFKTKSTSPQPPVVDKLKTGAISQNWSGVTGLLSAPNATSTCSTATITPLIVSLCVGLIISSRTRILRI